MCRHAALLDEFALLSATLLVHPLNAGAKAALRAKLREWRMLKGTERRSDEQPVQSTAGLLAAAAEADAIARAEPGYRADLEG